MFKKTKRFFTKKKASEPIQPAASDGAESAIGQDSGNEKAGFFASLKAGLKKTRQSLSGKMGTLLAGRRGLDDDLLEDLEELLIGADLGVKTTTDLIDQIRQRAKTQREPTAEDLKQWLKDELLDMLRSVPAASWKTDHRPMIVLTVGVNGVGKTTTIGKMAHHWKNQGKSVLLCAADTFRAAAGEQLEVWAERAGVALHRADHSRDPAAVVFEALERAKAETADIVLIDTAGRLHNNPNLMNELAKIKRVAAKTSPDAPHHVVLILDAVTGQNGLQQARQFVSQVHVTDLVIAKLDGTAKGGVAVAIARELGLPIQFLGVGEKAQDLVQFDPEAFVEALLEG